MMTAIHTRVLPEHQKKGLWGAVSRILGEKYQLGSVASQGFVSVNNAAMQRGFANTPNKWPLRALRCQLPCEKLAAPPTGRPAKPEDAARIVELLNGCHGEEELYLPYTLETLAARLARAPQEYSWEQVWLTDGAVVGVWPAGESIQVIVERDGQRAVSRRGLALDYGFEDGAEEQLERLLRAWCGRLSERGFDTLSVFTSERSVGLRVAAGTGARGRCVRHVDAGYGCARRCGGAGAIRGPGVLLNERDGNYRMTQETYTHGHHESVLRSHTSRNVANSAGYLASELRPGLDLLDVGCGPGTITVDFARLLAPGRVVGMDRSEEVLHILSGAPCIPGQVPTGRSFLQASLPNRACSA